MKFWKPWTTLALVVLSQNAFAARTHSNNVVESTQRTAETHIKNLVEPILEKYCHDECKLMSVQVNIDLAAPDQVAPGFDDIDFKSSADLVPSFARTKILIDEKVGPNTREKLLELVQRYLDTLDYPVKIDTQVTRFPQPVGSASRIAELREKIAKQFKLTVNDLFQQFCPEQCLLADFELETDLVNSEEAQYGASGEFMEDNGVAVRIKNIGGTILVDEILPVEERNNIMEMAKLKTSYYKNVNLTAKAMRFPKPMSFKDGAAIGMGGGLNYRGRGLASSQESKETKDSKSSSSANSTNTNSSNSNSRDRTDSRSTSSANNSSSNQENNNRQERFERFEKIERVESGDAVQAELQKFKFYGLIFGCSILSLLIFIALASLKPGKGGGMSSRVERIFSNLAGDPVSSSAYSKKSSGEESSSGSGEVSDKASKLSQRIENQSLYDELLGIFAQQPKVAKYVFTRILTEEGVETTANYIHIFGESIVMDMLKDPSLQADLNELMEFYAKNTFEIDDNEKTELLRALHNRTVAGKLAVMGSRNTQLFDFLAEMDGMQILEMVRNESLTVKSIVLTQCDAQKRTTIYSQLDEDQRARLLTELSRIDYLPRDYIYNVASALKRKRKENPRLNTEALPGSDVLVTLLERTGQEMQRNVIRNLEASNPDGARHIKGKLVSLETLRYLRDNQLLEVVLSLKHDELIQFLKGTTNEVRNVIFGKTPRDLAEDLQDELGQVATISRESYQAIERKILNRMKLMANEGLLNLVETNDRMLAEGRNAPNFVEGTPTQGSGIDTNAPNDIKKVAGW
ncbi:hypothetical protein K2X30_08380 [bacterium]|jgi:flagellar motor switch protein FliG|nr:hypothetical protein [bacterium]